MKVVLVLAKISVVELKFISEIVCANALRCFVKHGWQVLFGKLLKNIVHDNLISYTWKTRLQQGNGKGVGLHFISSW